MSRAISLVFWSTAIMIPTLAQTDAIAVSATKTIQLTPDEITFNLAIGTDPDVSLDQVLEATQALSIAASDLVGIGSQQLGPSISQTRIIYQFAFTTAFAKFKETNDKITTLRRSLAGAVPAMDVLGLSIVINPTDAARDQAFQTALPDLIADARRRADRLARAAGLTVAGIAGLNEILAPTTGISSSFGPGPCERPSGLLYASPLSKSSFLPCRSSSAAAARSLTPLGLRINAGSEQDTDISGRRGSLSSRSA